jgi:hypothetical protein
MSSRAPHEFARLTVFHSIRALGFGMYMNERGALDILDYLILEEMKNAGL